MNIVKGNLLDMFEAGEFEVIIHGCNCFHAMEGGIAAQIKARWPQAALADETTKLGDKSKLGGSTVCRLGNSDDCQYIINAYTQFYPGRDARLKAIKQFFRSLNELTSLADMPIGIPAIGCGIGGLTQELLEAVVASCAPNLKNITLVEYQE